jgi:PIN domain nuclease of toxin-antitoxin system
MGRCRQKYRNILSSGVRLLIDTHIFLWWDRQLHLLSRSLRAAIEDDANDIYVSAAAVWEIAIKRATGKLRFDRPIVAAVLALGFEIVPVTGVHAEHAGGLPRHHNDPFDRLIIAQAYLEGMVLGTQDAMMRPYGVATLGF